MQPLQNRPFSPDESVQGAKQAEAIINGLIGKKFTTTIVKVLSVEAGANSAVGFVDVVDMVQQMDADGNGLGGTIMYRLPYFRLQGGANAVVIDPVVGDIGMASMCMRDITTVKNTREESTPASRRICSPSDGLYVGGFLNSAPKQFIEFLESGVNITSTGVVTINGTKVVINAPIESSSTIKTAGDVTDNTASGNTQTMSSMRIAYNSHTHYENGQGSNTEKPNQQV